MNLKVILTLNRFFHFLNSDLLRFHYMATLPLCNLSIILFSYRLLLFHRHNIFIYRGVLNGRLLFLQKIFC